MDFSLTEEQQQLREAARRYLADRYPASQVTAIADGPRGSEADSWPELVRQGWLDPGLGGVERALLAEQSGYHLQPTPWWSTMALAAPYLHRQGQSVDSPCTFADGVNRLGPHGPVRAIHGDAGWRLSGKVSLVAEAGPARLIVVLAATSQGPALFTVDTGAIGLRVVELDTQDSLRLMARVEFDATAARQLVHPTAAAEAVRSARVWGGAMLAAEAIGVAARALDMAVAHARQREQFGRPIGSFQAVAHRLADAYLRVELARSLAYRAGWLVEAKDDLPGQETAVAEAVISARQAAVTACETAVQIAGGMGVTWEYPLHHWLRRALWLEVFADFGHDPFQMIAAHLLDGTVTDPAHPGMPNDSFDRWPER